MGGRGPGRPPTLRGKSGAIRSQGSGIPPLLTVPWVSQVPTPLSGEPGGGEEKSVVIITAVLRLQKARTVPGRFAFVPCDRPGHGIVKGSVHHYKVTAGSWAAIRRLVADYGGTPGGRYTMGYTNVGPHTVESFEVRVWGRSSAGAMVPYNPQAEFHQQGEAGKRGTDAPAT